MGNFLVMPLMDECSTCRATRCALLVGVGRHATSFMRPVVGRVLGKTQPWMLMLTGVGQTGAALLERAQRLSVHDNYRPIYLGARARRGPLRRFGWAIHYSSALSSHPRQSGWRSNADDDADRYRCAAGRGATADGLRMAVHIGRRRGGRTDLASNHHSIVFARRQAAGRFFERGAERIATGGRCHRGARAHDNGNPPFASFLAAISFGGTRRAGLRRDRRKSLTILS